MILRYENEVRAELDVERARFVRELCVERSETWRGVGSECLAAWNLPFGDGDTQSLGATLCHVAAELLGEDLDTEPWN